MTVGFAPFSRGGGLESLGHVQRTTMAALKPRHTILPYPAGLGELSRDEQRDELKRWLARCDVVVGPMATFLHPLLQEARAELPRAVPYAVFLLGCMPRGGTHMGSVGRYLRTSDILVSNCEADVTLARKFLPNAAVRCVPFAYDDSLFHPGDERARLAARASLGIGKDDKIVLYAGRVTLEKNLHTLLKSFRLVRNAVPNARLVIAGREDPSPFVEFGVVPLDITRSLKRLMASLDLDERQVIFAGPRASDDLRALYSAADVLVNLTLYHDENFGLAQVEAMACGAPTVGTAWGGLKDTIAHGETGLQVPTVVTATGIKVDWWYAANAIVQMIAAGEANPGLRESCCAMARARYSIACYRDALEGVMHDAIALAQSPSSPISTSAFAEEYWATCMGNPDGVRPRKFGQRFYRQGPESLRLYRELIGSFASRTQQAVRPDATHAWCLGAPVRMDDRDTLIVDDPLFPFEAPVHSSIAGAVRALAGRFTRQPVLPAAAFQEAPSSTIDALMWMQEAGLVLRTCPGTLDVADAGCVADAPRFQIQRVDASADIVWFS